ncbi:MAG TPA: hypothetical protein VGF30_08090 [Bacteroidia bacterium]
MKFLNSTYEDLDTIFSLFDAAIEYQKKKGNELWPQFSRELIKNEISEKRHWKIVNEGTIVSILSVMYTDPII